MKNSIKDIKYFRQLMKIYISMDGEQREKYYKFKCEYYQFFSVISIIGGTFADVGYLVSDYMLNGTIWPMVIPRMAVLIPLVFYLISGKIISNYKLKVAMNYIMVHLVLWSTMITVFFLEDKTHFAEGSYTLNLFLFAIGLGARPSAALLNYLIFFGEIYLTDFINHYPNLDVVISLNVPVCVGVLIALWALNLTSLDHYLTDNRLTDALVTDNLTKVGNREKLDMIVENNKIKGIAIPAAIAMIDVDFFKAVNDTYGHEMGDLVLAYLGKFMKTRTRSNDIIIRYGGEEFVIIMDRCNMEDAYAKLDKMREDLSCRKDRPVDFTISIGVSEYDGVFDRSLRDADNAMYDAKRGGRNMVCRAQAQ